MVEYTLNSQNLELDQIFHALADSTRRSILGLLKNAPKKVTELAAQYDMSLNGVSKHLKVLERAKLIDRSVQGRVHLCHLNADRLQEVELWMSQYREFWTDRLDALENFLESSESKQRRKK